LSSIFRNMKILVRIWQLPRNYRAKEAQIVKALGIEEEIVYRGRDFFLVLFDGMQKALEFVRTKNNTVFGRRYIGVIFENARHRKIMVTGSGTGVWGGIPKAIDLAIDFCGVANPNVVFLPTPQYDTEKCIDTYGSPWIKKGCTFNALKLTDRTPEQSEVESLFQDADIIQVAGGNTLFAVDRWRLLGIDKYIAEAANRGALLCGGSAGAISWFDAGHSDSMDPTSFKAAWRDGAEVDEESATNWKYIRVPALGFFPGILCPHNDSTQSNGIPRSTDMDEMLLRHPQERAICIDNYAALMIDGDAYRIVHVKNTGSVVFGEDSKPELVTDKSGIPGVWVKHVTRNGNVSKRLAPDSGLTRDLFRSARQIEEDSLLEQARADNPCT